MKKLALALMCLVSVAFFASCDPQDVTNAEPTIQVIQDEGFIQDNAVVDLGTEYYFGFAGASNPQTNKELASLVVKVGDTEWANVDLTGMTEFRHVDTVMWGLEKELIGSDVITAVLTDAAGKTATATINVSINEPAQPLVSHTFEWYRLGNTVTGLDQFGLWWDRNLKATHAQIKPLDGTKLFQFDASKWDEVATDLDKAALFSAALEAGENINLYDGINTDISGDKDYNDVIGTITEDGAYHLIHITHYNRGAFVSQGYPFTITGEAK